MKSNVMFGYSKPTSPVVASPLFSPVESPKGSIGGLDVQSPFYKTLNKFTEGRLRLGKRRFPNSPKNETSRNNERTPPKFLSRQARNMQKSSIVIG